MKEIKLTYPELEKRILDMEQELLKYKDIVKDQNIELVRKSVDYSDMMRQLEDEHYNLKILQAGLEKSLAALQESEERYRIVAETVLVGITMADPDENLTFLNPAFAQMLGYTEDELLKMNLAQLTVPGEFNKYREQTELRKKNQSNRYESKLKHKDGTLRDVLISASPIKGVDGSYKGSIGVVDDITDRKRAEQKIQEALKEKEVLLKEIHHRVKNNLQIISSLLNLQAMHIKSEDPSVQKVFKESQTRIRSMAMIHEKLYQSEDLAKVDIGAFIESLATDLFITYNVKPGIITLRNNVKNMFLKLDAAIPCCLLINELVSNSLKYAFPKGQRGEVVIDFQSKRENYRLTIKDSGIGFPKGLDFFHSETLGLQLVHMFVKKLHGAIEYDSRRGTEIRVAFKA